MSHLDEGTLHALLDGELETIEMMEIQAHLGSCAACGSRLREVKDFLAEADRLVGSVQMPAGNARPAPPAVLPERRQPLGYDFAPETDSPPVLLIPDTPDNGEFRRRFARGLGWAATILVAVGAGYLAIGLGSRSGSSPLPPGPPVGDSGPSPVLTPEEAGRPLQDKIASSADTPASAPAPVPPAARAQAPRSPAAAAKTLTKATPSAAADTVQAAPETRDTAPVATEDTVQTLVSRESTDSLEELAVRRERAEAATAELDRERRLARAAAATAALDASARARQAADTQRPAVAAAGNLGDSANLAPPPPAPAPRTLEQRSGIYLRIGLDEAARQLAGPVHVIEGMTAQFMGLAQGRVWPAADAARPIVRVVYQDPQGRMIVLDQQRVRPGQSTDGRWIIGDVMLRLSGETPAEVLRNLQARVR